MKQNKVIRQRLYTSYTSTLISVALVLFVLSLVGILLTSERALSNHVKEKVGFTLFLKPDVGESDMFELRKKIDAMEMVKSTEYVSAEEVRDVLSFLVKAGFLKKDDEKVYSQTEKTVIGSKEALPIAIRSMHREMANMASRAVDRYATDERYFTGITFSVNDEAYKKIVDEINACRKKVLAIF